MLVIDPNENNSIPITITMSTIIKKKKIEKNIMSLTLLFFLISIKNLLQIITMSDFENLCNYIQACLDFFHKIMIHSSLFL
jgi:hypothetical protein